VIKTLVLTKQTRKDESFEIDLISEVFKSSELYFSCTQMTAKNEWPYFENYEFLREPWDLCVFFNFDIRTLPFGPLINFRSIIHIDYDAFESPTPESMNSITRFYKMSFNATTSKTPSSSLKIELPQDNKTGKVNYTQEIKKQLFDLIEKALTSTHNSNLIKPLNLDQIINTLRGYSKLASENREYEDEIKKLTSIMTKQYDAMTELNRISHRTVKLIRLRLTRYPILFKLILSVLKITLRVSQFISKLIYTKNKTMKNWPDNAPLVSVIIPCYNYGDYIADAVDSVLNQTFQDLEIVIVDAGSTDKVTIPILKSLNRPRTRIFYREGRNLVGSNRNFGIEQARGKYVMCLDADDILRPTYIEQAIFLLETSNYDIISTSVECFGEKTITWNLPKYPTLDEIRVNNLLSTIAIYSKEFFLKTGGYHDFGLGSQHVHEDWCMWIRFIALGARVRNIEAPLMLYRTHSSRSLSQQGNAVQDINYQRKQVLNYNADVLTRENRLKSLRNNSYTFNMDKPFINLFRKSIQNIKTIIFIENADFLDSDLELDNCLKKSKTSFLECIFVTYTGQPKTRRDVKVPVIVLEGFIEDDQKVAFVEYLKKAYPNAQLLNWGVDLGIGEKVHLPTEATSISKNIHILICVPWLDVGGSSKLLMHIFSNLRMKGITTTIVATNPTNNSDPINGVDIYSSFSDDVIDIPFLFDNKIKKDKVLYLLGSRQCSHMMIVGSRIAYEILPKAKLIYRNLKIVDHLYNPVGHIQNNLEFKKYIDFNIAANAEVETALMKNDFPKNKIKIIHHGINTMEFDINRISKKSSQPSYKVTFGFIGRLSPEKRPLDFVELASQVPEANFVLAGQGRLLDDLKRKNESYGKLANFEFLGFTESPMDLYKRIDILVIPSEIEGLPLALLEAMSLKIPVIGSRVGHIPHVIIDGTNGYLIEPANIEQLVSKAKTFISLTDEERGKMGETARNDVVAGYDLANCADQYKSVFENLKEMQ
jgi:glycosyltransferase involved in cell wall biosynthesis